MTVAISDTSPLIYLHRAGILEWLPELFNEIWIPQTVQQELMDGYWKGYNTPSATECSWIKIIEPKSIPSEWFALDLGPGELAAISLALENPSLIVLLDDSLARRIAITAGLNVWGTLRVLLEAKSQGLTSTIEPLIDQLRDSGLWISDDIRRRILVLAKENN